MSKLLSKVPSTLWLALATIGVIVVFSVLSKRLYGEKQKNGALISKGADMMRHAADWTLSSQQSSNPVIALNHAAYAKAYINVARNMASDAELTAASAVPIADLRQDVEMQEERARQTLMKMSQNRRQQRKAIAPHLNRAAAAAQGNRWTATERSMIGVPSTRYEVKSPDQFTVF